MTELKRTPLAETHVQLGGRMVPFAGWSMPVQYEGILAEVGAVRNKAGIFDVSHMGRFAVTGRDAQEFLVHLLPNDVRLALKGQAMYSAMCYPNGGVIDDLFVYCIDESNYLVIVNASNKDRDWDWMQHHIWDLHVTMEDLSDTTGLLALQGPSAETILAKALKQLPLDIEGRASDISGLPFRHFIHGGSWDDPWLIARTGYSGEDGFEIVVPSQHLVATWKTLMEVGAPLGLKPAGLGSRDILRLEMGYALYGHELDEAHSPLSSGLGWTVKWDDHEFVGRDALDSQRAAGPEETLVFFMTGDRRTPRDKAAIRIGETVVGTVASGAFSPTLGSAIGSGFIKWNVKTQGALPPTCEIQIRDAIVPATFVKPPFVKQTSLRSQRQKQALAGQTPSGQVERD